VKEKLGRVKRSKLEDICAVLQDVQGTPHVELRVYRRSPGSGQQFLPGREGIAVPVEALPDVLQMLERAKEELVQRGLLRFRSRAHVTSMEAGEEVSLRVLPPGRRGDSRREPRLSLVVTVGCRLLDSAESKSATGQTEDVSHGGTKVWLTERFPLFSRVELFMRIGEVNFQGRAQVVAAEIHPEGERYRHSLQWLGLSQEAKTALLKLTKSLAETAKSTELNP
jgi:hypothetical protein